MKSIQQKFRLLRKKEDKDDNEEDSSVKANPISAILYDESIDVPDAEEVLSPSRGRNKISNNFKTAPRRDSNDFSENMEIAGTSNGHLEKTPVTIGDLPHRQALNYSDQSDNTDDDEDDDDVQAAALQGMYDPSEFDHLPVSSEIKDLFQNITRYTPQNVELDYKLKPFIPDFIPAVGDIDAFIKIPRPDGKSDTIGLQVLDEPCARQSEPAVLHLQLRAVAKQTSAKAAVIKKVENAEKNVKAIDNWIKDMKDLHRSKPPPTVHYSRTMPNIDTLMQAWHPEMELLLKDHGLPLSGLDCDLPEYVNIVCSLFDIPVYNSKIQSLHVLFSLYSAVKNSQMKNSLDVF